MTLVWLAATLAMLVFAAVWLMWDWAWQFRRQERARTLAQARWLRHPEDVAWTSRQAEYQMAMRFTVERNRPRLVDLVDADPFVASLQIADRKIAEVVG
jgi:hypothetical protein